MKLIYIPLLIILIVNCSNNKFKDLTSETNHVINLHITEFDEIKFSNIVSDMEFIEIPKAIQKQTQFNKLQLFKEKYLLSSNTDILMLDFNGNFISSYNGEGIAPFNYSQIQDVAINQNKIYIYDYDRGKMIVLKYQSGELIPIEELEFDNLFFKYFISKKNYWYLNTTKLTNKIDGNLVQKDILILDSIFAPLSSSVPFNSNLVLEDSLNGNRYEKRIYSKKTFHNLDSELYYHDLFNDTIFKLELGNVNAAYVFKDVEDNKLRNQLKDMQHAVILKNIQKILQDKRDARLWVQLLGINKNYIVYSYALEPSKSVFNFYNKLNDETRSIVFNYKNNADFHILMQDFFQPISYQDSNYFYSIVHIETLHILKEELQINNSVHSKKIVERIQNIIDKKYYADDQIIVKYSLN